VGPTIIRCRRAEAFASSVVDVAARSVSEPDAIEFGRIAASEASPIDDHRSTADYRRHAVGVLARRLLRRAFPNG
jgi:CO/xanthine dehydrogenase FAD-binding subunit